MVKVIAGVTLFSILCTNIYGFDEDNTVCTEEKLRVIKENITVIKPHNLTGGILSCTYTDTGMVVVFSDLEVVEFTF